MTQFVNFYVAFSVYLRLQKRLVEGVASFLGFFGLKVNFFLPILNDKYVRFQMQILFVQLQKEKWLSLVSSRYLYRTTSLQFLLPLALAQTYKPNILLQLKCIKKAVNRYTPNDPNWEKTKKEVKTEHKQIEDSPFFQTVY